MTYLAFTTIQQYAQINGQAHSASNKEIAAIFIIIITITITIIIHMLSGLSGARRDNPMRIAPYTKTVVKPHGMKGHEPKLDDPV